MIGDNGTTQSQEEDNLSADPISDVVEDRKESLPEVFKDSKLSSPMSVRSECAFSGFKIRRYPHLASFAGSDSFKASPASVLGPSRSSKALKRVLTITRFCEIEGETKSRLRHGESSNGVVIEGETKADNPTPMPPPKLPNRSFLMATISGVTWEPPMPQPSPEPPDAGHRSVVVSETV